MSREYKIIQGLSDTVETKMNELKSWTLEHVSVLRDLVSVKIIVIVVMSRQTRRKGADYDG